MNKLTIFDTHCHLTDQRYHEQNKSTKEIIQEAGEAGVKYLLNVGYDQTSNQKVVQQLSEFPHLFGALGLHPNSNQDLNEENLNWIEKQLTNKRIIAIGEIGLDYYRTFTEKEKQKYWFEKQLELVQKYNLPVCLHLREAFSDAYQIVRKVGVKNGILHCFTGDWEVAQQFLELGFYISFAGNITYQNGKRQEKLKEVIEKIPAERIVVETDAPYLSPEPFRGQINYPQNIIYTLKKLAEIKKTELEKLAEQIFSNTLKVFRVARAEISKK
ncbi:MAG: TatD family hydrolase [Candidatus Moeniiplasma glomeromycotorum]|nr:TatD family hydrolase [Candidatus Moeniiplasma glomeromycotorum]MCE8167047.1 TatD family hydrolase [Candidatus Moeniiplasma glomeromycotorum]MCE8168941.1 TatD family hydrolase [Candidatus Moeniiplasma glomeromycotorum]